MHLIWLTLVSTSSEVMWQGLMGELQCTTEAALHSLCPVSPLQQSRQPKDRGAELCGAGTSWHLPESITWLRQKNVLCGDWLPLYKHPFLLILIIAVAIAALAWYQSQSITLFVLTQQSCCTGRVASWLVVSRSMLPGKLCADRYYLPVPRA